MVAILVKTLILSIDINNMMKKSSFSKVFLKTLFEAPKSLIIEYSPTVYIQ